VPVLLSYPNSDTIYIPGAWALNSLLSSFSRFANLFSQHSNNTKSYFGAFSRLRTHHFPNTTQKATILIYISILSTTFLLLSYPSYPYLTSYLTYLYIYTYTTCYQHNIKHHADIHEHKLFMPPANTVPIITHITHMHIPPPKPVFKVARWDSL
jgi:hypothetical protein